MTQEQDTPAALQVEGLIKDFGGQRALASVDFDVRSGEIHALLGENGAGKSTLIKVLAGVYRPDGGRVRLLGENLPDNFTPADAAQRGLRFVHQDLGLVDDLSVAENIALERGYASRWRLVDMRATERHAAGLLERQGVALSPRKLVGELPQAEKVMVAIARAFSAEARVIVLDEVSASLPGPQVDRLADAVRRARSTGVAFVWVTHRLDEIIGLADRVTVLRDGRRVAMEAMEGVTRAQIIEWIIGRRLEEAPARAEAPDRSRESVLTVRGLLGLGLRQPIDLDIRAGEVLGITGLIGCGAQQVARLLGGSPGIKGGEAFLDGQALPLGRPRAMRQRSVNYVPGDRANDGAIPTLTVRENFFPARTTRGADDTFIRRPSRERQATRRMIQTFRVRPASCGEASLDTLSGGNQQKVIFGRSLRTEPRVLILTDPTAGVDVGARAELYALIQDAATKGTGVLLASSDFEEIVNEADRVLVMVRGQIACELAQADLSPERLAAESYSDEATIGRRASR